MSTNVIKQRSEAIKCNLGRTTHEKNVYSTNDHIINTLYCTDNVDYGRKAIIMQNARNLHNLAVILRRASTCRWDKINYRENF